MADNPQTLSGITSALAQTFQNEVKSQVNRMSVLLSILRVKVGAGKNVAWDVEYDGAIAENFSDGADVSNYGSDGLMPATLSWGLHRSNFRVTDLAAATAATSHSPQQVKDLIGRGFFNSMGKLASTLNGNFYSGAGTGTTIAGLSLAVDSAGTYAGIDRGSYSWWGSYEVDSSSAQISLAQIRTDLAGVYTNCGMRPDVALCAPAVRNKIVELFDAGRQWNRDVLTARGKTTLEYSSNVIVVDGVQFIEDKDCTAGAIYYLNSNEIDVEVLPQANNFSDPMGAASDGFNQLMLGFYAKELGATGASRKMSVMSTCQLAVRRPNAFGKRLNILTT